MGDPRLNAGIYAIINKKLNLVYVGETEHCILLRWIEHIRRIPEHFENYDRTMLYLHSHTKYIVLKELSKESSSRQDFYNYEFEAHKFYKNKGWIVVSNHSNVINADSTLKESIEFTNERYKKNIRHMIKFLGIKNTKNNNIPLLFNSLYRKINKHFNTDVQQRASKNILEHLTKEELEFSLLDLYPRFAAKSIDLYQKEYRSKDIQLNLNI